MVTYPETVAPLDGAVIASYRMTRHLSLVAEARFREVVSNDIRIQYERTRNSLGIRWEQ